MRVSHSNALLLVIVDDDGRPLFKIKKKEEEAEYGKMTNLTTGYRSEVTELGGGR